MNVIDATTTSGRAALRRFNRRAEPEAAVRETVALVLQHVRQGGDAAIIELTEKFDRARLTAQSLTVPAGELASSWRTLPMSIKRALTAAHRNVAAFARKSLRKDWRMRNAQGAVVGEKFHGFERVGIYVPGGTAPLVSTAIMTVTLANVAGCREIVACTPCGPDGGVNRALLAALHLAGATEVYRIGGIQAVAAMAFGTESISPVMKIFGPGNKWVIEAKRQVFGMVAIDQLPGPSEILILSDVSGRPDWIAADLIAQAEHGHDSQMVLVTPSRKLAAAVQQDVIKSIESAGFIVIARNFADGVGIANAYAPEHLTLITKDEKRWLPKITTAGAIFLGNHSPVAVGDYLAGPSHTLPTGGAGKSFSGLTVDQFQRRTSIVKLDASAAKKSAPLVKSLADLEGLAAHGHSAMVRS
jgi:histidinol dehydrogenase